MKECQLKMPSADTEHRISGVLRGSLEGDLAIIVPGLGGTMNDLLPYYAARYFDDKGLSSLRVDMFGKDPNQRNIEDCSLETMASDVDSIVEYTKTHGAKRVAVIGHSYGGLAILFSV